MTQDECQFPYVSEELMLALEERFSPMLWPDALSRTPTETLVRVTAFLEGGWHCVQSIRAEYDAQREDGNPEPEPESPPNLGEPVFED